MMRRKKIVGIFLLVSILLCVLAIYFSNLTIHRASWGKLYSDPQLIPYNKTGLLLGTAKYLSSGYGNPYYDYRIEAALRLLQEGKIKYLVISGDNGRKEYNEPEMMRQDLIDKGIDSNYIILDYAGFRTFDSVIRLKEVFGENKVTIISQPFHNERAIYIASREGVDAIGFNAMDVSDSRDFKIKARERLARVKVFLDIIFQTQPKFLGKKIPIPD